MRSMSRASTLRATSVVAIGMTIGVVSMASTASGQIFVGNYDYQGYPAVGTFDLGSGAVRHSVEGLTNVASTFAGLALSGSTLYGTRGSGVVAYTTAGAIVSQSLISVPGDTLTGIALSGSSLFVLDSTAGTIGQYNLDGTPVNTALVTGLSSPKSIAISGSNIFVASAGSNSVGQYTTAGATVNASLIQLSSHYPDPNYGFGLTAIAASGSDLYLSYFDVNFSGAIGKFTTSNGTVTTSNYTFIENAGSPSGALAVSGSTLYASNDDTNSIDKFTTSGTLATASFISKGLNGASAMVVADPADPTASPAWASDASGTWSDGTKWAGGAAPVSGNSDAVFGPVITVPRTVTLSANTTAQTLTFSSPVAYTVAGTSPLTLGGASTKDTAYVTVTAGSPVITAPIVANGSNLMISTTTGTKLSATTIDALTGNVTVSGTGVLAVSTRLDVLTLSIASTAFVDLGLHGEVIVNGNANSSGTVQAPIKAWIANHARGLGSSSAVPLATVGEIVNSNGEGVALYPIFDGVPALSTDFLIKYTYIGDTDLNGYVDGSDLANLMLGMTGKRTGWINGDTNYDNVINATDLNNLMAALAGQGAPFTDAGGGGGAVPEPAMLPFAALVLPALARRRRR